MEKNSRLACTNFNTICYSLSKAVLTPDLTVDLTAERTCLFLAAPLTPSSTAWLMV